MPDFLSRRPLFVNLCISLPPVILITRLLLLLTIGDYTRFPKAVLITVLSTSLTDVPYVMFLLR